jgi:hypothetical protein
MFKRLLLGKLSAFKEPKMYKFVPNEVLSKYIEIGPEGIDVNGKLPIINLTCGTSLVPQLYPATFVVSFHPMLKLGSQFVEVSLGNPDATLFGAEFENFRLDIKKVSTLPYIFRVYQLEEVVR